MKRLFSLALTVLVLSPYLALARTGGAPPPYFTTVGDYAGKSLTPGDVDGWRVSTSLFNGPTLLTSGARGGVFVVDANNNAIRYVSDHFVNTWRKPDPAVYSTFVLEIGGIAWQPLTDQLYFTNRAYNYVGYITENGDFWIAGAQSGASGYVDGPSTTARFNQPGAMVIDSHGNAYVADVGNRAIRKIDPQGNVSTAYLDPSFGARALALDEPRGKLYAAWDRAIFAIDLASHTATLFAGQPYSQSFPPLQAQMVDGDATTAVFVNPYALAVDAAGNVFVGDYTGPNPTSPDVGAIRQITPATPKLVPLGVTTYPTTVATVVLLGERSGTIVPQYSDSVFMRPMGLTFLGSRLIVSDAWRASLRYLR